MRKLLIGSLIVLILTGLSIAQEVDVSVTTVSYGGQFKPRHCLVAWITDANNKFIKSLEVNAKFPLYGNYLYKWISQNSTKNRVDAVTSASLINHRTHNLSWNCTNSQGTQISNGQYRLWVEYTEDNGAGKHAYYPFTIGDSPTTSTPADKSYFKKVSIAYTPAEKCTLEFKASNYIVKESDGSVVVTVIRRGSTKGVVGVDYKTSSGTATSGKDFTAKTGKILFGDGNNTPKTFTVNILLDSDHENTETINLSLANPTGTAVLGPGKTAVIKIENSENPKFTSPESIDSKAGSPFGYKVKYSNPSSETVLLNYVQVPWWLKQSVDTVFGMTPDNSGERDTLIVTLAANGKIHDTLLVIIDISPSLHISPFSIMNPAKKTNSSILQSFNLFGKKTFQSVGRINSQYANGIIFLRRSRYSGHSSSNKGIITFQDKPEPHEESRRHMKIIRLFPTIICLTLSLAAWADGANTDLKEKDKSFIEEESVDLDDLFDEETEPVPIVTAGDASLKRSPAALLPAVIMLVLICRRGKFSLYRKG